MFTRAIKSGKNAKTRNSVKCRVIRLWVFPQYRARICYIYTPKRKTQGLRNRRWWWTRNATHLNGWHWMFFFLNVDTFISIWMHNFDIITFIFFFIYKSWIRERIPIFGAVCIAAANVWLKCLNDIQEIFIGDFLIASVFSIQLAYYGLPIWAYWATSEYGTTKQLKTHENTSRLLCKVPCVQINIHHPVFISFLISHQRDRGLHSLQRSSSKRFIQFIFPFITYQRKKKISFVYKIFYSCGAFQIHTQSQWAQILDILWH